MTTNTGPGSNPKHANNTMILPTSKVDSFNASKKTGFIAIKTTMPQRMLNGRLPYAWNFDVMTDTPRMVTVNINHFKIVSSSGVTR